MNALGFALARLGRYDEAVQYHLRGLAICSADQDAIQQSHALHNLCVDHYWLGEYQEAYRYGRQSLAIAECNDLVDGIGYAQLHLGHVLAKLNLYGEARRALLEAREAFSSLGRWPCVMEIEAGLGHVEQRLGNLPAALAHIVSVLDYLQTHSLAGVDEPVRICLQGYEVLHAAGDPCAQEMLGRAYQYIQTHAGMLDAEARHVFLTAVPANRTVLTLWQQNGSLPAPHGTVP